MIGSITEWILESLRDHGALSVFVGVLIEQVIVPIPSPAIIMGAGFILIPADVTWAGAFFLSTLKIVVPGVAASTLGAVAGYYVGRWGGKLFVDRFHRFLGFTWRDVESIGSHFTRRGEEASIFFLRAVPIVPLSLISIAAGVLEIPPRLFTVWTVLGAIPRCYLLALLGWLMGSRALSFARGVDRFESLVSVLIVLIIAGTIVYIRRRVRRQLEGGPAAGGDR